EMFLPMAESAFGILVPKGLMLVDPAKNQNIHPAVGVQVMHIGEHAVGGIRRSWKCHRGIELVLRREARPLIPEWPGDDVGMPVAVDIARGYAVAIVFVRERDFPKR